MKMKEFGPRGGGGDVPGAPLDPPMKIIVDVVVAAIAAV